MRIVLSAILLITSLSFSFAQDAPQIPDQIKKLYDYEGKFEGTGYMKAGDQKIDGKLTHTWKKITDGFGMMIEENIEMPSINSTYRGVDLLGYDVGTNSYHMYTVDNFGDVHDHKGKVNADNSITFEHDGTVDGKPYVEIFTVTFNGKDAYKYEGTGTLGGVLQQTFTGDFKRVK